MGWTLAAPLIPMLALYLLATGRWGSYVSLPGLVVYVGDIVVGLAALQAVLALALGRASLRGLRRAPVCLLLSGAFVVYAAIRFVVQAEVSLLALRDLAPYGYAVVAVLTFLLPVRPRPAWRLATYAVLLFHLGWVVLVPRLSGYPWTLPVLGTDAQVFSARPDFDAAVLGISAALAVHDLLSRGRAGSRLTAVALLLFAGASVAGMLSLSTRAGLLAGMAVVGVAVVTGFRFHRLGSLWTAHRAAVITVSAVCGVVAVIGIAVSPAGARLGESFSGGAASGTVSARQTVWSQISRYVLAEPERAAVGVGFGRDFIAESGTTAALEGGVYSNVRSPHNYVLGTGARLGVGGALLAVMIMVAAGWAGFRSLRGDPDTLTALAAFVVIGIPVVALLGVVLESPFGAIPYFWAIGQLAVSHVRRVS
jgi:hypothetical protein